MKETKHPEYGYLSDLWHRWRLGYEGGEPFIDYYLQRFSNREDWQQFLERKQIAYLPAFAKEGINDIKNAIFQRVSDVTREGGSTNYQTIVSGAEGGVDLRGSSMGGFMGRKILPELLVMAKVGIYVDMPRLQGETMAHNLGLRPYIYSYTCENIINWNINSQSNGKDIEFTALLLRDWTYNTDPETGLATEKVAIFRHLMKTPTGVKMTRFSDTDVTFNGTKYTVGTPIEELDLEIKQIPFVLLEITDSLMKDIVRYQASLLNLASSDMFQLIHANFPFLVKQQDPRDISKFLKGERGPGNDGTADFDQHESDTPGEKEDNPGSTPSEKQVGPIQGMHYSKGTEAPKFINPSPETVIASMDKQNIMKEEIRELLSLSLSNIQPRMASAEAKQLDERGLESGLSAVALELEQGERGVAKFIAMYENTKKVATIKYPERYALQSTADRRAEIKELAEMLLDCPSKLGRKGLQKKMIELALGNRLSDSELTSILSEIDDAVFMSGDPKIITVAVENQLVSADIAAQALGLPGGPDIKIAEEEHAERAARVAKAQAKVTPDAPRGVVELNPDPKLQQKQDDQKGKEE